MSSFFFQNQVMIPIVPEVSLSLSFDESSFNEGTVNLDLPVKNSLVSCPATHPTDQENRAPVNVVPRQVGKQVLVAQSPQREPLKTITAQHVNSNRYKNMACFFIYYSVIYTFLQNAIRNTSQFALMNSKHWFENRDFEKKSRPISLWKLIYFFVFIQTN